MSGGSMSYIYSRVEDEAVGKMGDPELDALMLDIVDLLHDCEWWTSDDISEETYRETVRNFKARWLGGKGRSQRLKEIISVKCAALRRELLQMIGEE